MFAVLPASIQRIDIVVPDVVTKLDRCAAEISIRSTQGDLIQGLIPLYITIRDSQGTVHDFSDYSYADGGKAKLSFPIAINEPTGVWRVDVQDLYSGTVGQAFFQVNGSK